jgi:hypothetical protein
MQVLVAPLLESSLARVWPPSPAMCWTRIDDVLELDITRGPPGARIADPRHEPSENTAYHDPLLER